MKVAEAHRGWWEKEEEGLVFCKDAMEVDTLLESGCTVILTR